MDVVTAAAPTSEWKSATCSRVTALEPVDCLRANKRTQLTVLRSRALEAKESSRGRGQRVEERHLMCAKRG